MTWWEDLVAWVLAHLGITMPVLTWFNQGAGGVLTSLAQVAMVVVSLTMSLAPYLGIIMVFYFIDVLQTSVEQESFQPIGNFVMRLVEIVVGIGEALAAAVDALIPL